VGIRPRLAAALRPDVSCAPVVFQRVRQELSRWVDTVRARRDPAQPPVLGWQVPYLGSGLQLGLRGPAWLLAQHRRVGAPFSLYLLGRRFTLAHDPAFLQAFFHAGPETVSFFAGLEAFPSIAQLIPMGMTGPEGANVGMETFRQFVPAKVLHAGSLLDDEGTLALHEQAAAGSVDLQDTMRATMTRLTAMLLAGPRLAHDPGFVADVAAFDAATITLIKNPWSRSAIREGVALRGRIVGSFVAELQRRRAGDLSRPPQDFVDALLRTRDPQGAPFPDEALAIELHGYMFAMLANTPAAASMCLLHILVDPELRRRIEAEQAEVRRVHGEALTHAALKDMPLLHATHLETLRLYAGPMQVRKTRAPVAAGPYTLPAGSMVAVSAYVMHRDASVYTDPEVFDPDRFIKGPRGPGRAPAPHQFLAYGWGLHACIGRSLARQEIMLTIARLLRDFEVELAPCQQPLAADFLNNGTAGPRGRRTLRIRRRAAA